MKDLPHHLKKLNTKILRSEKRIENENVDYEAYIAKVEKSLFGQQESPLQKKKKKKLSQRKEFKTENLSPLGPEEKERIPRFRERAHKPPMQH